MEEDWTKLRHELLCGIRYDQVRVEQSKRAHASEKHPPNTILLCWSDGQCETVSGYTESVVRRCMQRVRQEGVHLIGTPLLGTVNVYCRVSVSAGDRREQGWLYSPVSEQWYRPEDPLPPVQATDNSIRDHFIGAAAIHCDRRRSGDVGRYEQ